MRVATGIEGGVKVVRSAYQVTEASSQTSSYRYIQQCSLLKDWKTNQVYCLECSIVCEPTKVSAVGVANTCVLYWRSEGRLRPPSVRAQWLDEDLVCLGSEGHWPYSNASDSDKHLLV